jgi:hypothetical protein
MRLYVAGGQQRRPRSLTAGSGRWYKYQKGIILDIETDPVSISTALEYESPREVTADEEPAVLFKQGTVHDGHLYLATQTEVLVYTFPQLERVGYITLPVFNDVHHVRPTPAGTLLVVSTGLDLLLEMTKDGEILQEWSVVGEDTWSVFDRDVDYRKVESTKHLYKSHPNYVFMLDDEVWVTRFKQQDAVSIADPSRRIDIGGDRVHDGVLFENHIYFTSVDGSVVIVDRHTLNVEERIDLNELEESGAILGWCRGVLPDPHGVWVGFSRLRPTAVRENVAWVRQGFKKSFGTHIARYDLKNRRFVERIQLEDHGLNAVFSLFAVDDRA